MSLYAMADDVFAGDVASTGGWSDFGVWVESLDDYPELHALWNYGWSQEPRRLQEELATATGMNASVRGVVAALLAVAKINAGADVIIVTDGVGGDDGVEFSDDEFDLPKGRALVPKLRDIFEEQRQRVLARLGQSGTVHFDRHGLPDSFVNLEDWNDEIARESMPVIELSYDKGVRKLARRLGASPDVFSVISPKIKEAVAKASLKFAQSTNETTSMQLNDALAKLRSELEEGLVSGDPLTLLRDRVNEIFDQASQSRAMTIASTEASRALHEGRRIAAIESGVVSGKKWLLSSDACETCQGIARRFSDGIPLDASFGDTGYGPVMGPPAHPD